MPRMTRLLGTRKRNPIPGNVTASNILEKQPDEPEPNFENDPNPDAELDPIPEDPESVHIDISNFFQDRNQSPSDAPKPKKRKFGLFGRGKSKKKKEREILETADKDDDDKDKDFQLDNPPQTRKLTHWLEYEL
mmetsp:Transcript_4481/g.5953  ORF Transcript_4481/g.5953 Transcript_4481/m.5953 type:complete len:134 (+) Transcript_4481:1-402(+)